MNSGPETSQARRHPHGRRFAAFLLLAIRHSSGWILRIFFTLLILMILLFAYLHLVGLPVCFTDLFLDRMAAMGYHLQIERLTLEIDRGLVARNIRLYADADSPTPFLEAETMAVMANPWTWLRRRPVYPILAIENGSLRIHLGRDRIDEGLGPQIIAVDRLQLRFSTGPDEVRLHEFAADLLNIHFQGRGQAYPAPRKAATGANPITTALQALENAPVWLLRIVEQLQQIAFNAQPSARFTFALFGTHPEANTFSLHLDNPVGGRFQRLGFDQFQAQLAWKAQKIHLATAQLRQGSNRLGLSGWLDLTNQMVHARLFNTLPPDVFVALLPPDIQQKAAAFTDDYDFPLRLELQVGPCSLAEAAAHLTGTISLSEAAIRDVPISSLRAAFECNGPVVRVNEAAVQLGTGPHASRVTIQNGAYRQDSRQYQAHVSGTLDPHLLKPLMSPGMRTIVEWFGIQEPVAADVVLGGEVGNPAIYCFGPVQATNFTVNGVACQSMQGQLNITNEVMHITGARLQRMEGNARGDVHMVFSNQTLRLEAESTLAPRAIAEMLGPGVAQFMAPFRFNGPARVQITGWLDFCNFALNRLEARVDARGLGYDRWEADHAVFDLSVRGRRLLFSNAFASAYGGQFTNINAHLYPVQSDTNWRYEVEASATNVSLTNLLFASTGEPTGELRGRLDGTARIGGYIGTGTAAGVSGTGQAAIREGLLFQTRLFSGLSAILSKVIPDFTLFAQTDASAGFRIRNGRVISRDIELQGTLFSVKAKGEYFFTGVLDYDVEIQLLRGGPVAALVRLATSPVTRLLKANLTGTFQDPHWGLVNPLEKITGKSGS